MRFIKFNLFNLDELIGRAVCIQEPLSWGVTVDLSIKYKKPVPLEQQLIAVGRITRNRIISLALLSNKFLKKPAILFLLKNGYFYLIGRIQKRKEIAMCIFETPPCIYYLSDKNLEDEEYLKLRINNNNLKMKLLL